VKAELNSIIGLAVLSAVCTWSWYLDEGNRYRDQCHVV